MKCAKTPRDAGAGRETQAFVLARTHADQEHWGDEKRRNFFATSFVSLFECPKEAYRYD